MALFCFTWNARNTCGRFGSRIRKRDQYPRAYFNAVFQEQTFGLLFSYSEQNGSRPLGVSFSFTMIYSKH